MAVHPLDGETVRSQPPQRYAPQMKATVTALVMTSALLAGCGGGSSSAPATVTATTTVTTTSTVTVAPSSSNAASTETSTAPSSSAAPTTTATAPGPSATQETQAAEARAMNPVTLLKKLGHCVQPAGASQGDTDIYGERMASCDYMDNDGTAGTNLTAYTFTPGQDAQVANQYADDSHKIIRGDGWRVIVTGDWSSYSSWFDPKEAAKLLGGKVSDHTVDAPTS